MKKDKDIVNKELITKYYFGFIEIQGCRSHVGGTGAGRALLKSFPVYPLSLKLSPIELLQIPRLLSKDGFRGSFKTKRVVIDDYTAGMVE